LISRFSFALSRVIDNTAATIGGDDDDVQEIVALIDEMNSHHDLTVKLNNQSKLLSIFTKPVKSSNALLKKKIDENLKNLDPEIKNIIQDCKNQLEAL